jgi:hypothetical protein
MLELPQCLGFDLLKAYARHRKLLADFFQGVVAVYSDVLRLRRTPYSYIRTASIGSSEELPKKRRQTTTLTLASLPPREERIVSTTFCVTAYV